MRKIIAFFVRQNLFGDLLTVSVIGVGIAVLFLIKREVFPNVNFDVVTVSTIFPGASPEEVEKLITNRIEQDLQEVDGIKRLQSNSIENRSGLTVWLDPDQTTAEAGESDIQDVVDRLTDLPEEAEETIVTSLESKQSPIMEVSIAGEVPPMEMRALAKRLEKEIERVSGVARVVHRGLRDIEIRVEADKDRLSQYRLSLDDLILALKRQNVSIPGGTIEVAMEDPAARERIVRTIGEFHNLDDVRKTVIRANDLGQAIRVADVAKVSYELERATLVNHTRGLPALSLTILKKERADAIDVVDSVKRRMEELKPSLDPRIRVEFINDLSQFIRRRLSILTGNLTLGLALVLLMLPLLIPFRFSILIALGEPFAFLGTLIVLHVLGYSINLISMIGLIIVSGILVDDSIVVTENAVRLVEDGMDPYEAAVDGTMQIIPPVVASVSTAIVAFLPMAFMSGIFGKFVKEIPIAVLTALLVSLFETFFILPGHIAHWIKPIKQTREERARATRRPGILTRIVEASRGFWDTRVVPLYVRWLKRSVQHRYWVSAALVGLFVGSIALAVGGMRFILFPPEGVEIFFVRTEAPNATSLDRHAHLIRTIENAVAALPKEELDTFTTSVGIVQQDPHDPNTRRGAEYAQVAVYLTPENERTRTAAEIIEDLRAKIGIPQGLNKVTFERVNPGPPTGKPVSLGVRAREYDVIMKAVADLKAFLAKQEGVTDIEDSYTLGKQEVRLRVNSAEAAAAGLSVVSIGNTVRAAYEGLVATTVRELDEEMDVRVSLPKSERTQASSLEGLLIPNARGNLVPLSSVARQTTDQGLAVYEHEDNQRQIKVTADVNVKVTTAIEVNGKVRKYLPELRKKHPGVTIDFGGEDEDTQESLQSLGRAFGLAILGIFLILVLTFKSLVQPLVVLITVPLGIIAVIWAFFLHGMPLSFMGVLGIIALSGVIVNNAIVFVDFVNQRRNEGADPRQSILEAAETRLRPIFLTTVTTVIGLLPTAYGIGGLDKFVVPIAMSLAWGLMFGSILTAFVFPAALAILDDFSAWSKKLRRRRRQA